MVWPRTMEGQPGKVGVGGADGSNRRIRGRADRCWTRNAEAREVWGHCFGAQLKCVQSSPTVCT